MFKTIKTLFAGANARAEERVRDTYSIELIEQKIREAQTGLKAAKATLASLIQRSRAEGRQIEVLETRAKDMTSRAKEALKGGREDMANEAAQAIAEMENELTLRRDTASRLETRIIRLRQSAEATNRRIIDLKQGAIAARAVRQEQDIQKRLNTTLSGQSPIGEAQELIERVLSRDDPFEQGEILKEIDQGLSREDIGDRMANAGFGPATKVTADDVLKRLSKTK